MNSSPHHNKQREAQYGRLVMNVLNALNQAVARRQSEGETRTYLAEKIGCDRSQISRTLNGNVKNITIRTISDILWAARHEPEDFSVDAFEDISPNYVESFSMTSSPVFLAKSVKSSNFYEDSSPKFFSTTHIHSLSEAKLASGSGVVILDNSHLEHQ